MNIAKSSSKKKVVLFNGALGTVFALWLNNYFVNYLTFLNTTLPPIGAILIVDFFIIRRMNYPALKDITFKAVQWPAICAWAIGSLGANLIPGVTPLNAVLVASISYLIFYYSFNFAANKALEKQA